MIGKYEVREVKDNDIVLNNKIYKGTYGLWKLLIDNQLTYKNLYMDEDLKTCKNILLKSYATIEQR
jgi:hypothetical protein